MNQHLYGYSLCAALTFLLFFGIYFLTAKTPDKPIFGNYLRSRRIMGVALLGLAARFICCVPCVFRIPTAPFC